MNVLLSKALTDAMRETDRTCAEVVRLQLGQSVEVRTRSGSLVAVGSIMELNVETGVVRVADRESGSDMQVDVDTQLYDVWVLDRNDNYGDPDETPVVGHLAVHSKKPGAYGGGRF